MPPPPPHVPAVPCITYTASFLGFPEEERKTHTSKDTHTESHTYILPACSSWVYHRKEDIY